MENRLCRHIESQTGLWNTRRFISELHPSELQRLGSKLRASGQTATQTYVFLTLLFFGGSHSLHGNSFFMNDIQTFAYP